jgi:hypothetical protein
MLRYLLPMLLCGCRAELPELQDAHRDLTSALAIFPGAEGFGTDTPAGRGGHILRVTTLAEEGPGSLKEALQTPGARVIVFETSGVIGLTANIKITAPFVTIAGQTAPAPGITIIGGGFEIETHDILIQHLRIRPGDRPEGPKAKNRDAIALVGDDREARDVFGVVVDHCSLSWGVDEIASAVSAGVRDVTFSNNLISEALNDSIHPEGPHSKGLLVGNDARRISLLRNVFAHNDDRNPFMKGNTSTLIANNLVYDYGRWPVGFNDDQLIREPALSSILNNVYIQGPSSPLDHHTILVMRGMKKGTELFAQGIVSFDATDDPASLIQQDSRRDFFLVDEPPVTVLPLTLQPAEQLEALLLGIVGAVPRDAIDARVIAQIQQRIGRIIDSQEEVGGFPVVPQNTQAFVEPAEPNGDEDGDGYTNLEELLHTLAGL